jgi:hypothetical protein
VSLDNKWMGEHFQSIFAGTGIFDYSNKSEIIQRNKSEGKNDKTLSSLKWLLLQRK